MTDKEKAKLDHGEVWREWLRVTRFFHSAQIAIANEIGRWSTVKSENPENILIQDPTRPTKFTVQLPDHLNALQDDAMFFLAVLNSSTAIAEKYTRAVLKRLCDDGKVPDGAFSRKDPLDRNAIDDMMRASNVEYWGTGVLACLGLTWQDVGESGLVDVVEAYIARNALAHGQLYASQRSINRIASVIKQSGLPQREPSWKVGDCFAFTAESIGDHRDSLKRYIRAINTRIREWE